MKKYIISLFIFSLTLVKAQNKQELFLSIGKPSFNDKANNQNNYSIGAHYINKVFDSFSFEGYLEYAQSNNIPDFIEDSDSTGLDQFIKTQTSISIIANTFWSKINYVALGSKVHYTLINTDNFFFSAFAGLGYNFSNSEVFLLNRFGFNQDTGEIIEFESSISAQNENTFFTTVGLRFSYAIQKKYTIGLLANFHSPIISDTKIFNNIVISSNYNLALTLGKQF